MPDEDGNAVAGNPWTVLEKRVAYDNAWIRVVEHDVLNPAGNPALYGVVHMKNLAVGVLPLDDEGQTFLVGQHRFPRDYFSWELPEGGGSPDLPAEVSAARELREETGLQAGSWHSFLRMDLSNSITDETAVGFIAWDLEQFSPAPEEAEKIIIRRIRFAEALDMAVSGEIADTFTLAMLFKARLLADRQLLPPPVMERIALGS
jgi:8-oxo-dGTP pyrophosphatase MutT (NUDIX family)